MKIPHTPVLLEEVVESFKDIKDGYIVDCTLGYGGHSEALLKSNPNIKLIGIDQDIEALEFSKRRLRDFQERIVFKKGRFSTVINELKDYEIRGVLADIGVSSLQLDKQSRGFKFESDTLDMRMDRSQSLDAKEVVNSYSQSDLERIFKEYGQIKEARKMASLIIQNRPFHSAKELSSFIAKHFKKAKIHPATLAFQAIRIEVNDELGELKRLLHSIKNLNRFNLLVAIITFHSLEDKIVKQQFKEWSKSCICPPNAIRCECGGDRELGLILTKKPIVPTGEEIARNHRCRSSKLRLFRFTKE